MIHNVKTSRGGVQNEWTLLDEMTLTEEATQMNIPLAEGYDEYMVEIVSLIPPASSSSVVYPKINLANGTLWSIPFWDFYPAKLCERLNILLKTFTIDGKKYGQASINELAFSQNTENTRWKPANVKETQIYSDEYTGYVFDSWNSLKYERTCVVGSYYKVYGRNKT